MKQTPGSQSTPDVLAQIDGAVEQRCACGCGKRLDPDGPSAYYWSEQCQKVWMARQVGAPEPSRTMLRTADEWGQEAHRVLRNIFGNYVYEPARFNLYDLDEPRRLDTWGTFRPWPTQTLNPPARFERRAEPEPEEPTNPRPQRQDPRFVDADELEEGWVRRLLRCFRIGGTP